MLWAGVQHTAGWWLPKNRLLRPIKSMVKVFVSPPKVLITKPKGELR